MDIKKYLEEKKQYIDSFLKDYFKKQPSPTLLQQSMIYSLTAKAKRIRPILCISSYEACCGNNFKDIIPFASAIEFIHTYSLIHDDLPSMDNDDLRRGMPTNHKVFGEAIAILAGDGLLTEAFYIYSNNKYFKPSFNPLTILKIINELTFSSGINGMAQGQAQDLLSESSILTPKMLLFIHTRKTADLITTSVRIGGLLAGAKNKQLQSLTIYGKNIGLAFQIIDDILDITDEKKFKLTYPRLYGIKKSKKIANTLITKGIKALDNFNDKVEPLREIAKYLLNRQN